MMHPRYMKAGQRLKEEADEAIRHDIAADDEWERIKDERGKHYDADPIPPSDAGPGL